MNYWEQIAEMLGVELGEEFEIEGEYGEYKICDDGLLFHVFTMLNPETSLNWDRENSDIFYDLISGKKKIIKKSWIPKCGDKYWLINSQGLIYDEVWEGAIHEYAFLKSGWVFRTKKEAKANRNRILAEYEKIKAGELDD